MYDSDLEFRTGLQREIFEAGKKELEGEFEEGEVEEEYVDPETGEIVTA